MAYTINSSIYYPELGPELLRLTPTRIQELSARPSSLRGIGVLWGFGAKEGRNVLYLELLLVQNIMLIIYVYEYIGVLVCV